MQVRKPVSYNCFVSINFPNPKDFHTVYLQFTTLRWLCSQRRSAAVDCKHAVQQQLIVKYYFIKVPNVKKAQLHAFNHQNRSIDVNISLNFQMVIQQRKSTLNLWLWASVGVYNVAHFMRLNEKRCWWNVLRKLPTKSVVA